MIFLSYLSGSHFIMKVLLVGIIIFLSFRYLKISKYAFISSIFLFLGTFLSFWATQYFDERMWAQWLTFTLICVLGYHISLFHPNRITKFLIFFVVTTTIFIWILNFNFPVGKGRMFLDHQNSALFGKTINGLGSEVNYTAFFLVSIIAIFALKYESFIISLFIPVVGLLQNNNAAFAIFVVIFGTLATKKAWIPVVILLGFFTTIFLILNLVPETGMPIFGPRYILWNTAIEVIKDFPNLGYGYSNSRSVMENVIENFDKQYYVHNGFLEAGMAGGPLFMFVGCGIIIGRLYLFILDRDYRNSALMCMAVMFITFNAGFLGSISLGGLLLSMLIGCKRQRLSRV